MPATITAIGNQKGGVGKTTATLCLASELARLGQRVLVLDLDMQHSASTCLGVAGDPYAEQTAPDIVDVLVGDRGRRTPIADAITATSWGGVDAIPSSLALAGFERSASPADAMRLRQAWGDSDLGDRYDHVLIDLPPSAGLCASAGIIAADQVLAVVVPESLALAGLSAFLDTLDELRSINTDLNLYGVLVNRASVQTREHRAQIEMLSKAMDDGAVLAPYIPTRIAAAEVTSLNIPPHRLRSAGAREVSDAFSTHARRLVGDSISTTEENRP